MPPTGISPTAMIDGEYIADLMSTHRLVGVPYTDEMIAEARFDFVQQATDFGDAASWNAIPAPSSGTSTATRR
jgi:cytochrome c oxidase cbb3-type subunit 2